MSFSSDQACLNSGEGSTSRGGSVGRAKGGGMMSMMDEMQKTLARRREKTESESPSRASPAAKSGAAGTAGNSQNRKSGSESPKMPDGAGSGARRRLGSVPDGSAVNGDAGGGATTEQMEALKQEILREMRKEVDQMKKDIIEAIRTEMRR